MIKYLRTTLETTQMFSHFQMLGIYLRRVKITYFYMVFENLR